MFVTRLTSFRCATVATGLAGLEAPRSMDESRFMTAVNPFLLSKAKSGAACAPTDPASFASPGRQGWNTGARTVPVHMFDLSKKMPAIGFDGDSKKLLADVVKEARTVHGITYAKIGQCNEDQLCKRRNDQSTYPAHIYDRDRFRILMHGVLGRSDGRLFESSAAKANNALQGVRLNEQLEPLELEPLEMANGLCAGTATRPIAIYMYPVLEQFAGRGEQLSLGVESHKRVRKDTERKEPSDMQQEDEDDETHAQLLKFLKSQRASEAMVEQHAPTFQSDTSAPITEADAKPKQVRSDGPMELFGARKKSFLANGARRPSRPSIARSPSRSTSPMPSRSSLAATMRRFGAMSSLDRTPFVLF